MCSGFMGLLVSHSIEATLVLVVAASSGFVGLLVSHSIAANQERTAQKIDRPMDPCAAVERVGDGVVDAEVAPVEVGTTDKEQAEEGHEEGGLRLRLEVIEGRGEGADGKYEEERNGVGHGVEQRF